MNSMNRILDHDHSELDILLGAAFRALTQDSMERAFERLDLFWARLAVHIRAENMHLFPALLCAAERAPERGSAPRQAEIADTIAQLRVDHDFFMRELMAAMKDLRESRRKALPAKGAAMIAGVRDRLERVSHRIAVHNALEESGAYRWVCLLLDQPKIESLAEDIGRELGNLPARLNSKPVR